MSAIKWFNNLLLLENFLGIYRNYCSQKKKSKYFIILKIVFHTMFYFMANSIKLYYLFGGDVVLHQFNVIYGVFSVTAYLNVMSSVVTGICYSSEFMSYFRSINRVSDWFKNDKALVKSLKKVYWFTIILTLFFVAFVTARSMMVLKKFPHMNEYFVILIFLAQATIRITIIYQQIMLFVAIMIIVYLFKSLNLLISTVQEKIASFDISSDEQCDITSNVIQEWVELYRDIVICCEKVTFCFGRQYFFSLVLSIPNYILMFYQILYQVVMNKGLYTDEFKNMIIASFTYGSVMMLPVVAGQLARNQGGKFHRVLARLYNTMIINDSKLPEVKLLKDFIRLMKKNPIEIKLLTKIPAGMYMLPFIIMLSVNYVIILLQFNHVI